MEVRELPGDCNKSIFVKTQKPCLMVKMHENTSKKLRNDIDDEYKKTGQVVLKNFFLSLKF